MTITMYEFGTVLALLLGIASSAIAVIRTSKGDTEKSAREMEKVLQGLEHLSELTTEIRAPLQKGDDRYIQLTERVVALESSVKNAHKRIDAMQGGTQARRLVRSQVGQSVASIPSSPPRPSRWQCSIMRSSNVSLRKQVAI